MQFVAVKVDEAGNVTLRYYNHNTICIHAVQSIQALSEIVKQQQLEIHTRSQKLKHYELAYDKT